MTNEVYQARISITCCAGTTIAPPNGVGLVLKLSLKIEIITEYVEQQILSYKQININSQAISAEEASHNVGAVDALEKVLEMLRKQP